MSDRTTSEVDTKSAPSPSEIPPQKQIPVDTLRVTTTYPDTDVPDAKSVPKSIHLLKEELGAFHIKLRLVNLLLRLFPHLTLNRLRTHLYRVAGVQIGNGTIILGTLRLTGRGKHLERLRIGSYCVINAPICFNLEADITIGNRVYIGNDVMMVTSDHEIGSMDQRCSTMSAKPIEIGDGCWIGAGAMIAPGIKIGRGSVVSMGAVVGMDVPESKLVAGNPARPIRTLAD